jgi:hypothetical protein
VASKGVVRDELAALPFGPPAGIITFAPENVRAFAEFLEASGGFSIS